MNRLAIPHRASTATQVLEETWTLMRKLIEGLPTSVITFVDIRARSGRRGHFAAQSWRARKGGAAHEVAINPALFETVEELLETMLHEAAHAVLFEEDPHRKLHNGGCSLHDPHYHTEAFKLKCEELGLHCELKNRRYGYSATSWPDTGVPKRYKEPVAFLKAKLPRGTLGHGRQRRPPQWNPLIRIECGCEEKRIVYMRRRDHERGGILCRICGEPFAPKNPSKMLSKRTRSHKP